MFQRQSLHDPDAPTALQAVFAAFQNSSTDPGPLVEAMLDGGADAGAVGTDGLTMVYFAYQAHPYDSMAQLLKHGANPNCKNGYGNFLLGEALQDNDMQTVRLLLKYGANPNREDSNGVALRYASTREEMETLFRYGAKADGNGRGSTPLMDADNASCAKTLLEHGARIDAVDSRHETALNQAVQQKRVDVVRCLLEDGANPNIAGDYGTPLQSAAWMDSEVPGWLSNIDLMRILLDHGARINEIDILDRTPLMLAINVAQATLGERDLPASAGVKFLLDRGANVNIRNKAGKTALTLALEKAKDQGTEDQEERKDSEYIVALLKQHGARR